MSVTFEASQPHEAMWWLVPVKRKHVRREDCPDPCAHEEKHEGCRRGYDVGQLQDVLAVISSLTLSGRQDEFSYVVTAPAQYAEVKVEVEAHKHAKIGYLLVTQFAATGGFDIVMTFGAEPSWCAHFLEGFSNTRSGMLEPGDRLFLVAENLAPEHKIECSSAKLKFKDDIPAAAGPPNTGLWRSLQ